MRPYKSEIEKSEIDLIWLKSQKKAYQKEKKYLFSANLLGSREGCALPLFLTADPPIDCFFRF